ncbi:MAG: hypothetical protein AAF589_08430 [Planctomycetota bacterium]
MARLLAFVSTIALVVAGVNSLAANRVEAADAAVWVDQRQVGPFVVRASFDLSRHEALLDELPALERELRRVLALSPCREPIEVLIYGSEQEHRDELQRRFPGVPYRRALYVKQSGHATVFAYRHEELAIDVRHECTHALLHADLPMLPLWLDEGLAEYFEMPAADRAFRNPHGDALRWNMRLGLVRSVAALESRHELADLSGRDYQFAWAWTHFLLHGPKPATEQLWAYLSAIRRGEPPGLLSARLEKSLPGTDRQLVSHFRNWDRLRTRIARTGAGDRPK